MSTVLILLVVFAVIGGGAVWLSTRCPSCGKFVKRSRTEHNRPDGGIFEPAQTAWECPNCGHRQWRED